MIFEFYDEDGRRHFWDFKEMQTIGIRDGHKLTLWKKEQKGQWVIHNSFDGWAECSKCHYGLTIFEKEPNYCPNCGAKMKGGAE